MLVRDLLGKAHRMKTVLLAFVLATVAFGVSAGETAQEPPAAAPAPSGAAGSNPLSSTTKLDIEWNFTRGDGVEDHDMAAKLSAMVHPRWKLNIEAHYLSTDVTGSRENDWQTLSIKPIYFVTDFAAGDAWKGRLAVGAEWVIDADNEDKGIGTGSDLVAPLVGLAFARPKSGTVLIPLVQHFHSYNGDADIDVSVFRFIALQVLPGGWWSKADIKIPYDWENERWPVNGEVELGTMLTKRMGLYAKGLAGVGGHRPFDWGVTAGVRVNF
jgi:hypothetical protein